MTNTNQKLTGAAKRVLMGAVLAVGALGCEKLPELPEVPNIPPVASFFFSPVSPINAGQTAVGFNASSSKDSDGSISSYVWNFYDGSPEQTGGPAVNHVFPVVGQCLQVTYTVLLTVVDNKGGRGFANQAVTVTNLPAPSSLACPK